MPFFSWYNINVKRKLEYAKGEKEMNGEKNLKEQLTEKLQGFVKEDLVGTVIETGEDYFIFRVPTGQSFVISVAEKEEK